METLKRDSDMASIGRSLFKIHYLVVHLGYVVGADNILWVSLPGVVVGGCLSSPPGVLG